MRWLALVGILLLVLGTGIVGPARIKEHQPGVLTPDEPLQQSAQGKKPWKKNGYLIRPLASFSIRARVLLTDHYSWDRESELSPVDLTLGWGPLSDSKILSTLKLSHGIRHYRWSSQNLVLPYEEINAHMANMHIIPSDQYTENRLKKVIPGDIVSIEGYLIEAATPDGWSWKSSLTRTDAGQGACEVIWADKLTIEQH